MTNDAKQFRTKVRLYTRVLPVVSSGVIVYLSGYLAYHPVEELRGALELWGGLVFVVACMAATEILTRLGFSQLHLERHEVKRSDDDKARLDAALASTNKDDGRALLPTLIDVGEVALLRVPSSGRLFLSTHALHSIAPDKLALLIAQALEKLAMGVMLERILFTAAVWWMPAVFVLLVLKSIPLVVLAAIVFTIKQLFVQGYLFKRENRQVDAVVAEKYGHGEYAEALAAWLALKKMEAGRARSRIAALELKPDQLNGVISRHFPD